MAALASTSTRLVLDDLDDLFVSTPADPWRGRFDDRPGVERLADELDPTREPLDLRVTVAGAVATGADERVAQALAGWAGLRLARVAVDLARIRRLALKELGFGIAFLATCLVVSSVLTGAEAGPEWLRTFVVEGLVIVGWIALWHPVDMLFFERLPLVREQRVLHRLRTARVHVESRDEGARG